METDNSAGPKASHPKATDRLMAYLDASPTAYQAVETARKLLLEAGFERLDERDRWELRPETAYFTERGDSSIVLFRTGTQETEAAGLRIVTAHTDSPSLKLKPASESGKEGAVRYTVEVYGGPIYHTWLDRELSIAGAVTVRGENGPELRVYDGDRPVAIIPNAAIHLNREANKGYQYNPQDHLKPVFSLDTGGNGGDATGDEEKQPLLRRHLAGELDVEAEAILDFDLYLCDRTPARRIGLDGELLASGRLDNLAMCHAAIEALTRSRPSPHAQVAVLFDNEEVGSRTYQGADGTFLRDTVERIVAASEGAGPDAVFRALANSAMISGDAAHGVHPSYADKHDEHYRPKLNGGPVVKISGGKRYTTTAHTAALYEHLCSEVNVPVQRIISRSDASSGSTVGPVVSSRLGIPSLDIGHPIWGMHSVRETGGTEDHALVVESLKGFFESPLRWS